MKNFFKVRGLFDSFKGARKFSPFYAKEWKKITESKKLSQEDAIKRAEDLIKDKKYIESMITLDRADPGVLKPFTKEISVKRDLLSQFVKNEMILRRYSVFKKYISLGDEYNKLVRSSFFTFLILSLSFFLYFGSLKDLRKNLKKFNTIFYKNHFKNFLFIF
jgi:hypothetical protein